MFSLRAPIVSLICATALSVALVAATPSWVPEGLPPPPDDGPALCVGKFLTPEEGAALLNAALERFPDRRSWTEYVEHVRGRMQEALGLAPWPERTPLNAVIRQRREYDGYSVESVVFESVPGCYVTGSLYRPLGGRPPHPVILATHGHYPKVQEPEDYVTSGRFWPGTQLRCATLARMGAIVFAIDMFAYGDSAQIFGQKAHRQSAALTIQTWNNIRALDFLLSLEGADRKRVAVNGESGGGTQTMLLTALDERVTVSVPVVMVSNYMFGGCPCESGLPIHRSDDHFVSNAMIAAMAAPRPMLVVSDGNDWTQNVPESEFPFLQRIYGYFGKADRVKNVHLADERHDFGPSKRAAVYRFLAEALGLDLSMTQDHKGNIDEWRVTVEKTSVMRVFDRDFPVPLNALHDAGAILGVIAAHQKE